MQLIIVENDELVGNVGSFLEIVPSRLKKFKEQLTHTE